MKIFSWMQSKLIGKNGSKKHTSSVSANNRNMLEEPPHVDETRDRPDDLLSIGTFGNIELTESVHHPIGESSSCAPQNFTAEEEGDIFHSCESFLRQVLDPTAVSLDKGIDDDDDDGGDPDYSKKVDSVSFSICNKSPDICLESNRRDTLAKRSMAYLLKKMLICSGGFPAMPSLRDPFPTESRMEKIMKAILLKKIHPQTSNPLHKKKYLTSKQTTTAAHNKKISTNWNEDESGN